MLQSAKISSDGLDYTGNNNLTIQSPENEKLIVRNEESTLKLTKWFGQLPTINRLQYSLISAGTLHKKERIVLKFVLADGYTTYFTLLRGLFEFGKQNNIAISSNHPEKSFTVEVGLDYPETAITYFENIFDWFAKEIRFKVALKKVMQWEKSVRNEQQSIFNEFRLDIA